LTGSFSASSTFAESVMLRQWMPVRSLWMSEPIAPPWNEISAFCGSSSATEL
jgi:hypothetical protein